MKSVPAKIHEVGVFMPSSSVPLLSLPQAHNDGFADGQTSGFGVVVVVVGGCDGDVTLLLWPVIRQEKPVASMASLDLNLNTKTIKTISV